MPLRLPESESDLEDDDVPRRGERWLLEDREPGAVDEDEIALVLHLLDRVGEAVHPSQLPMPGTPPPRFEQSRSPFLVAHTHWTSVGMDMAYLDGSI